MKRLWHPLSFILLLALALRLVNLGGRSLWYDESFAVLFSEKGLNAMLYGTLTPVAGGASDIHPLLYYTTLNVWMALFGQSAAVVRLWSVILGVATVGMMYLLGRELFGEKTGLAAALITALAPFHVQYSQETRMYALLGLLLVAATWCFIKGWRTSEPHHDAVGEGLRPSRVRAIWTSDVRWWLAFGVLAALAMYTQQLAAFYLVALGLIPLVTRRWQQTRRMIFAAIVAVIIYLPWLVNLPSQFEKVRSYYWIDKPGIGALLRTIFSFTAINLDIHRNIFPLALILGTFLVLFLAAQVFFDIRRPRMRADRRRLLFVLWLAAFPPALMWLVSQFQSVYLERSLLPSALMLYLAFAWLFTRGTLPRPIAAIIAVMGVALVGIGLYFQYTWATFPNSPFQPAVAHIHSSWQEGDVVIHQNKISALPSIYYDRTLAQHFLGDAPGSAEDTLALPTQQALNTFADVCVQSAAEGSQRVWWVTFNFAEQQYADAGRAEFRVALDWLNAHYSRVSQQSFNDLDVTLFADPQGDLSPNCEA